MPLTIHSTQMTTHAPPRIHADDHWGEERPERLKGCGHELLAPHLSTGARRIAIDGAGALAGRIGAPPSANAGGAGALAGGIAALAGGVGAADQAHEQAFPTR